MTKTSTVPQAAQEIAARIRRERQGWGHGAGVVWMTPDGKPPRQMSVLVRGGN